LTEATAYRWTRCLLHNAAGEQVEGWALGLLDEGAEPAAFVVPRADGRFAVVRRGTAFGAPFPVTGSLDDALAVAAALVGVEWPTA